MRQVRAFILNWAKWSIISAVVLVSLVYLFSWYSYTGSCWGASFSGDEQRISCSLSDHLFGYTDSGMSNRFFSIYALVAGIVGPFFFLGLREE